MTKESSQARSDLESLIGGIAEDYLQRLCNGEEPDVEEFERKYPEAADVLRQILPALEVVAAGSGADWSGSDSSAVKKPDTPEVLGDFRIVRQIGRGGMGVVYEAEQVSVGRRVALKILPFAALLSETRLERFRTESTAAARLQHSGIVQVYSVGCERGIHFYAMQLVDGPSLTDVIADLRQSPLPDTDQQQDSADTIVAGQAELLTRDDDDGHYRAVARIGREAAESLQYAHENGVLHRDIKPSNLLLDAAGHVWIADFGLARVDDATQLTRTGDILGTLRYMSPEQATGEHGKIDARSDVYGLGATLYELATLRPAFDSEDRRDISRQITAGHLVAPHTVDDRIPKPLSYIISKAMACQIDERYQSAQELADDLQRFLDGEPVTATPPSLWRRSQAWARRHRLASISLVGLLILVLLLPFTTHHLSPRAPDGPPTKGPDMNVSKKAKVAVAAAAIAIAAAGVNAKKPTPPPPPEPVPVEYQLTFFDEGDYPAVNNSQGTAINDSGVVVGYFAGDNLSNSGWAGFRWTPGVGTEILDDLSTFWYEYDPATDSYVEATGWETQWARDINESGQIVGHAIKIEEDDSYTIRPFIFTEGLGFYLLPMPNVEIGTWQATMINDNGDVMGTCYDTDPNTPYGTFYLFFWSPLNPDVTSILMYGVMFTKYSTMGENYFSLEQDGVLAIYAYQVDENGILDYELDTVLPEAVAPGIMSSNGIVPFVEGITTVKGKKEYTKYYATTYDVVTNTSKTAGEVFDQNAPLGGANQDGDFVYVSKSDGLGYLYRASENRSYKIYDLLDDAARYELYDSAAGRSQVEFPARYTQVNTRSTGVPTEAPFDCIISSWNDPNSGGDRGFILTPVQLP